MNTEGNTNTQRSFEGEERIIDSHLFRLSCDILSHDIQIHAAANRYLRYKCRKTQDMSAGFAAAVGYARGDDIVEMNGIPRYIVFDVETPNRYNNRMSAIGIAVVENGVITDEFFSYVNPESFFDYFNIRLTGINEHTVENAPTFPELWKEIEPLLSSGFLVAHNAVFDLGVLKKCLREYGIIWRDSVYYCCTVQMGRRLLPEISHKLNCMCDYYGIDLDHHKADSDSRAAAEILIRFMESGADVRRFVRRYAL